MKKFILVLAVIALALAQGSCTKNSAAKEEGKEENDTCIIDTLETAPIMQLDSICND